MNHGTSTIDPQQQRVASGNQQAKINKLLNEIPSDEVYNSIAGEATPRVNMMYRKTSTPIAINSGKHVPIPSVLDATSLLKPMSSMYDTDAARFFPIYRTTAYQK